MDSEHSRRLADGNAIPVLGLGVWQVAAGEAERVVAAGLELGYRHVDTAQIYKNEAGVGRAIAASGIPREEIFVTTKFDPRRKDPERELERSLDLLGLVYVDLYLVHWPAGGPVWAWPGMEETHARGLARSIGVSNFDTNEIAAVLDGSSVPPSVNQIEFNAFAYRRELQAACERAGLAVEAYSPLTTGRRLNDARLAEVAERVGRTPAQVLLRWALQRGTIVLPKSVRAERMAENAALFDFELDVSEMATLDGFDTTGGTERAREGKWW